MPGIRLQAFDFRGPLVDKDGNATAEFQRWMTLLHAKVGGNSAVLPVNLGGTGGDNIIDVLAIQASSPSSSATPATSASNAKTERETFVLDSPATDVAGDYAETICIWATPFADASYKVSAQFLGRNGTITILTVTALGFTVRLENATDGRVASGSADCIGVHP